ncbi:TrbC/VirB2 family protein [Ehrlichia ruminantium]|uniref:TrbC/VirB2 family protein n=1 Tax=Ehrlichia ruminantium TaxID=779 RepID=UPI002ED7E4BF
MFFIILGFTGNVSLASVKVAVAAEAAKSEEDTVTKVICNVIGFVQTLGLPIMTGVILGSSIMAIFGKLPWPAIVMLVVFTAIFFGAGKLMTKFAKGVGVTGNGSTQEQDVCKKQ